MICTIILKRYRGANLGEHSFASTPTDRYKEVFEALYSTGYRTQDLSQLNQIANWEQLRPPRYCRESVDIAGHRHRLCNELYNQGDIDDASYAALPHLVRIYELRGIPNRNAYAVTAAIELARDNRHNPELSNDLREAFDASWRRIFEIGLQGVKSPDEDPLVTSIISVL